MGIWPPVIAVSWGLTDDEKLIESERAAINVCAKKSFWTHLSLLKGDQSIKVKGEQESQSCDCKFFKRAI